MKTAGREAAVGGGWGLAVAMVAPVWAVPALAVNVDWSAGLAPWNIVAVGSIAGAAMFAAAASDQRFTWRTSVLLGALAALFMAYNTITAYRSASHRLAEVRDHRQSDISDHARLEMRRSHMVAKRTAAAMVAGEKPRAALMMEVEALKLTHAVRWTGTDQCRPGSVTAAQSMQFCARLATLRGQVEAAGRRDALDAEIEEIDRRMAGRKTPGSADPSVDSIAAFATAAGFPLSRSVREAVPAIIAGLGAALAELLATLGPTVWLMWWRPRVETPRARPSAPAAADPGHKPPTSVPPSHAVDNVVAFSVDRLERVAGGNERAGDLWKAWQAWCAARSIDPGSQKAFGQAMARQFEHDRNNGRPQYLGVSIRKDGDARDMQKVRVLRFGQSRRTTNARRSVAT